MGTWDAGNFDNDAARNFLVLLMERWIPIINEALAGEVPPEAARMGMGPGLELIEGCVMPTVELFIATIEHVEGAEYLPTPRKIAGWSELALASYDAEIDGFDPGEEFKAKRRRVIAGTFARPLAISEAHEKEYGQWPEE
jgi:hypothetical protein